MRLLILDICDDGEIGRMGTKTKALGICKVYGLDTEICIWNTG